MTQKPYMINFADMPWVDYGGATEPGRYGSWDKDITDELSARKLSCVVTKLDPGKYSCPYHFHRVGEELFIILEGEGTLRYNGETRRVKPHDVIACPPGPGGAHQFINDGDKPLVYFAISTQEEVEIAEYPDSNKLMAYAKEPEGRLAKLFKHESAVPYMEGEIP